MVLPGLVPFLEKPYSGQGYSAWDQVEWDGIRCHRKLPCQKVRPPPIFILLAFFNLTANAVSCLSVLNLLQKHCFLGFFPQVDALPVFQTCF